MHPRGTGGHFGGEAVFSSGGAVGSGGGAIGTSGAISLAFLRRAGGGAIGTSGRDLGDVPRAQDLMAGSLRRVIRGPRTLNVERGVGPRA